MLNEREEALPPLNIFVDMIHPWVYTKYGGRASRKGGMNMVIVSRPTTSRGFEVVERWLFRKEGNEYKAKHMLNNSKGTYCRDLGTRWFKTAEEGNEFFKSLKASGFKVTYREE